MARGADTLLYSAVRNLTLLILLYTQSRALSALGEAPLTLMALKSLIGEGDKCRVFFEEIRVRSSCLVHRYHHVDITMSDWGGRSGKCSTFLLLPAPAVHMN